MHINTSAIYVKSFEMHGICTFSLKNVTTGRTGGGGKTSRRMKLPEAKPPPLLPKTSDFG